ncbi:hypothetical protein [Emticicia sp. 21SJ11W-3]|uniref:hypothetical protein n=1 Tax=Emticicia sp. 21SJ11W-3 TaxID=2916755 RepID=UPI0020A225BB|nr:hypothetical protein [Emticicia sp. 21SJ11W-3]UTA69060.1 hypothetical protein MB380_04475 [Emticicia sp. 21SJ11W-3]
MKKIKKLGEETYEKHGLETIRDLSAYRQDNWHGQYDRMLRWAERFRAISQQEIQIPNKSHTYFDTMYACFQNLFFLKDWIIKNSDLPNDDLNNFINNNEEIGICRDICNGTKHYNISHPSVDENFGIIHQYLPYHKVWNVAPYEIIICAGGKIYKPIELIEKCINIWDTFIYENLNLTGSVN